MRLVYFVGSERVTPDEPSAGWYVGCEGSVDIDGDGPRGSFEDRRQAIDYQYDLMRHDKLTWLGEYKERDWRTANDNQTFQLERGGFVITKYIGWGFNEVRLTPKGRAFVEAHRDRRDFDCA